jgi:Flp pilus assembly protein TadD
MLSESTQRRLTLAVLLGVPLAASVGLGWFAWHSPSSRFLPPAKGAEWIAYPMPPWILGIVGKCDRRGVFRRSVELPAAPASARLHICAFKNCTVRVNDQAIELPAAMQWNDVRDCVIGSLLQSGTNEIEVVVVNDIGPPALWFLLEAPDWSVASDEQWTVSQDGATARSAHIAGEPLPIRRGNGAEGGDKTLESLRARWPTLLVFAAIAATVLVAANFIARRQRPLRAFGRDVSPLTIGLCASVVLWIVLFIHNTFQAPSFACGFDAPYHIMYIQYILDHGTLPLADEGWELHHPPLYYTVAAVLLRISGLSTVDAGANTVFRFLGLATGLAQLALVAGCMRLLFPGQTRRQLAGLALAAFLPANLYTGLYVTNESFVTVLGTAAIYLCLRVLRDDRPSPARHALLGLCLGGALLSKVTALVVVGVVLIVLTGRLLVRKERDPSVWLRSVGVTLLVTVLVSGWHFVRVWSHFGTPLVGNYDPSSGLWWWQQPGLGTAGYLYRFGRCLTDPYFSAFNGLPDGLYSTFWGDGLCGGVGAWRQRPPWNYDLMAVGILLALLPTVAVALGLVLALVHFLRRPNADWYLLFGIVGGLAIAVLYQMMRYPYYGHARASYLLTCLVTICALGALGFDFLARLGRAPATVLAVVLGTWALTGYTSFWIKPDSAASHNWAGLQDLRLRCYLLAEVEFREAIRAHPDAEPRLNLARALILQSSKTEPERQAKIAEAHQLADDVLLDDPDNAEGLILLANVYAMEGRFRETLVPLRKACAAAPDHPTAYSTLGGCLARLNRDDEALDAFRHALGVTVANPEDSGNLALLLARRGRIGEAIIEFRRAIAAWPKHADMRTDLAWLLATQDDPRYRNPQEALLLAQDACRVTESHDALALLSLAAAQAACGRFSDAMSSAGLAAQTAARSRQAELLPIIAEQVKRYQEGKPLSASPPLRTKPYSTGGIDE